MFNLNKFIRKSAKNNSYTGSHKNCIILLDASGSMNLNDWKPNRLKGAIESAEAYIHELASKDPDACVAVVLYGTKAKIIAQLAPARNFENLNCYLNCFMTGFATNIAAALKAAYAICSGTHGINHVILLSDGYHNAGGNPKAISDKLKQNATIECIGIGGSPKDVDENLMRYIASYRSDGTKQYRWIGNKEILIKHFRNSATGLGLS